MALSVMEEHTTDWQGRARREAVAILEANGVHRTVAWEDAVTLMAVAWLQGVNLGAHDTLRLSEAALERLKLALTE
jgi:hypothetical protein